MGLEEFCGSEFWDENLTWYPANHSLPDVTPCMENICLLWVPCATLWLVLLPYICSLKLNISGRSSQPLNTFIIVKSLIPVVLIGLNIYDLFRRDVYQSGVALLSSIISIATLILAIVLIHVYRKYGQFTSGPLWVYWLLSTLTSVLRSYIYYKRYFWDGRDEDVIPMALYTVHFLLYAVGLAFSSVTDASEEVLKRSRETSPEVTASFPSLLVFHFLQPMMKAGYDKKRRGLGIEREDLYYLAPWDRVHNFFPPFEKDWKNSIARWRQRQRKAAVEEASREADSDELTPLIVQSSNKEQREQGSLSLIAVLMKHWLPILSLGWMLRLLATLLGFMNPIVQKLLITYMESQTSNRPDPFWKGILYSFLFFLIFFVNTILWNVMFMTNLKGRLRIKSALIAAIYRKSLTMSGEARQDATTGEIVNLMSIDTFRTVSFVDEFWVYLVMPLQIIVAMYLLHQLLGNSVFAGVAIMVLSTPVSFAIGWFQRKMQRAVMKLKDERIKMINETLTSIKVIKLYAWEPSFEQRISELRKREVVKRRTINILNACQETIYDVVPVLVTVVTFAIYTSTRPDHTLKASVAFVALSLFDMLKDPLNHLPRSISYLIMCAVSVDRIVRFFKSEDLDVDNVVVNRSAGSAVQITGCTFSHIRGKPAVLHDINLSVKERSLTAIVGSVGAGKSSLLTSLIGDMYKHKGNVTVKGTIALVSQQAFILNATVKSNILFGAAYDEELYEKVIKACALTTDFEVLPKGDRSMIGEKGINLSGGQKQRISLARAVYNDADIYLLDDPLSAVDAHVGKHIFDNVIGPNGLLKQKTRLMVTHGVQWLPLVQEIYVIKSGRLSEHGTYDSLLTHNGDFAKFLKTYFLNEGSAGNGVEDEESDDEEVEGEEIKQKVLQKLESLVNTAAVEPTAKAEVKVDREISTHSSQEYDEDGDVYDDQEEVETGKVDWSVYLTYIKAMGSRHALLGLMLVILCGGMDLTSYIWISQWTGDKIFRSGSNATASDKQSAMERYIWVLSAVSIGQVVTVLCFILVGAYCFCRASANLHRMLLHNLLKAKVSFFDVKPLGMILNRFSKDMDIVDNSVGWSIIYLMWTIIGLITCVGGIIYATPLFVIAIIPISLIYIYIQRYYISTARQLRRLTSKAASPIYAHFSETLNGAQTIRAYKHQERFIQDNIDKLERYNVYKYFDDFSDCWLDVRMTATAGVLVFLTALFCIISTQIPFLSSHLTPSLVGLALSLVLEVTNVMNGVVWTMSNVETNIVSVERIKEYSEVEREADWTSDCKPPRVWPSGGVLQFHRYAARYRPELDLVIKDFSLNIKSQEKVGIVGRTGAGKSSLTLSLFRILESAEGSITIDDVDISKLGLHDLRNSITILPQDPVMFSGSIRDNLDPLSQCADDRLWQVLDQCQLKEFVSVQPEQLSAECGEGGQNLSVGQRQLICLARALLRKTKILVMDEATAAVDLKTDDIIQRTIRSEFADCTILTIAHRLNTIIDCDRILVMSQGNIAEFDTPQNLLANKQGIFYNMARDAGLTQ